MREAEPAELLDDHDIRILNDLSMKLLDIWHKELEDKQLTFIYDNVALDNFMSEFTLMINDFIKNKNIKNYISHAHGGPSLSIDVKMSYDYR